MDSLPDSGSTEAIKKEVKEILSKVSRIDVEEMGDEVLIREELGIDSLMAMEILATCEKHLGIAIDETVFADVEKVGEFFDLLIALRQRNGAGSAQA